MKPSWILYVSTYPPRECGIATFTKDLITAMDKKFAPAIKSKIAALNSDKINIYNYPEEVLFEINDSDIQEYIDTAKKINKTEQIKLVNIQHEFGILGGENGSYLIAFLEALQKPVVVTFHSVIPKPNDKLLKVIEAISQKCSSLIVMTKTAVDILRNDYGLKTPIEIIPHGIPTMPYIPSIEEKTNFGYKNRILMTSFGMMNPGKGYEYVLDALPEIIKQFPSLLYLIIGETHPVIRMKEGEQYRNFLEKKVRDLGIQNNVKFYNKYVKLSEIVRYLHATDMYICSNNDPNQITSGTLAYAVGAGRVAITTPFLHAKDLITPDIGLLTEFSNSESFKKAILKILSDNNLKRTMEKNAYIKTRHMTWPNIALSYMQLFNKYIHIVENFANVLPKIKMNHLVRLTDDFGIIQFANLSEPDTNSGYTLDDNARALIAECMYFELNKTYTSLNRIKTYLNFIKLVQTSEGKLLNIVSYDRVIDTDSWSEDAHGRALWALGFLLSSPSIPDKIKAQADAIFDVASKDFRPGFSRASAFAVLGHYFHLQYDESSDSVDQIAYYGAHLKELYTKHTSEEWRWFEPFLTYSNSKLPEALFYTYLVTHEKEYLDIALTSLDFLIDLTFENDYFAPIGQKGWYFQSGHKAHFDQQPVDAASMVQTLTLAHKITGDYKYLRYANIAFQWFLGKNSLNQVIYDETTGGCQDGLSEGNINLNQGAESTISYLLARLIFAFPIETVKQKRLINSILKENYKEVKQNQYFKESDQESVKT